MKHKKLTLILGYFALTIGVLLMGGEYSTNVIAFASGIFLTGLIND